VVFVKEKPARSLTFCVLTCDQAIYEICLALKKKFPQKNENLILRMVGFQILTNFDSAFGKIMDGTGIEQQMVDNEVYLPGTAQKIMAGKDYCQMVHEHKLVEDAIYAKL
jgi:hypothetical protein